MFGAENPGDNDSDDGVSGTNQMGSPLTGTGYDRSDVAQTVIQGDGDSLVGLLAASGGSEIEMGEPREQDKKRDGVAADQSTRMLMDRKNGCFFSATEMPSSQSSGTLQGDSSEKLRNRTGAAGTPGAAARAQYDVERALEESGFPGGGAVAIDSAHSSGIASMADLKRLAEWVPKRHSTRPWVLKYSLRRDGASLETLLSLVTGDDHHSFGGSAHSAALILIEDSWGYQFGGFIGQSVANHRGYYGNGESFVFSLQPKPQLYRYNPNPTPKPTPNPTPNTNPNPNPNPTLQMDQAELLFRHHQPRSARHGWWERR